MHIIKLVCRYSLVLFLSIDLFSFFFFIAKHIHTHTLGNAILLANFALKAASVFVESGPNQFIMFICCCRCWRKICNQIQRFSCASFTSFQVTNGTLTRIKENINFPWILFVCSSFLCVILFVSLPMFAVSRSNPLWFLAFIWNTEILIWVRFDANTYVIDSKIIPQETITKSKNCRMPKWNDQNQGMHSAHTRAIQCLAIYQFQTNEQKKIRNRNQIQI